MTDPFVIRLAERADAGQLSAFAADAFRVTYRDDTPASDLEAYIEKSFVNEKQEAEIADPQAAVFIATSGHEIIGYAQVLFREEADRPALLNRIYVASGWKGLGVAGQLFDTVRREAGRRGARCLELSVFEKNARAIAFYQKLGFTVTGKTSFTVGDDVQTDFVMELALADNG